jgi:hypothetical protein
MKEFIVHVKEVHYSPFKVKAKSREDAIMKVREGEGDALEIKNYESYSETLDSSEWMVEVSQ